MTIRVQASTTAPVTPGSTASADSDSPADLFAALLGSQLSVGILPGKTQGGKLDAALADGKGASHDAADGESGKAAAVDPATILAMPVFIPVMPQQSPLQVATPAGGAAASDPLAAAVSGGSAALQGALPIGQSVAKDTAASAMADAPVQASLLSQGDAGIKKSNSSDKTVSTAEMLLAAQNSSAAATSTTPINAHPLLAEAAALAQPAGAQPVVVASAPQALPLTIREHLSDSNWSQAMGHQLMTMVNLKSDQAHISLNPSHLGPIEVSLKIDQNQAQVVFNAATPQAREAVENSLPRLASMLAGNGIQLSDAQVSSGQSGNQRQAFGQQQRGRRQDDGVSDEPDTLAAIKTARGILSTFA